MCCIHCFFFFQAEDGIRDIGVTGVQTCALPIWALLLGHGRHGDPTAVVDHGHRVVGGDRYRDLVAVASQSLIHRVINNLVDKIMQTSRPGRANVHTGSLTHRLKAFEHGDVLRVVTGSWLGEPGSAVVVRQRSSDDVETPRTRAYVRAPGRSKTGVQNNSTTSG